MDDNMENYTAEELEAAIEQEMQMKKMMDQSIADLKETISELDLKHKKLNTEGNEWKTRYETQHEMNTQLERQMESLKDKIQLHNGPNKKDNLAVKNLEEMSDTGLKGLAKQLEKEKNSLEGQLRDMEWRLDQESKALHKATEGRKKYVTDLMDASYHLDSYERLQGKQPSQKVTPGRFAQRKLPHAKPLGNPGKKFKTQLPPVERK
uniref:Coiled-coil domain-containing protein 169-like n=1 Tax=Phallusia mammillata TaxID=59560 RepID=A0A6F9D7Y8_9ASCI|nr:coiled-coil domain-containing protein 169-like [Phallusia mammillata]